MPQFVVEELAAHLTSRPADPEALVWTSPQGGPLRYSNFMKRARAVDAAQLGRLTPHELRHTAASLLIAEGASPKSVQAQLGHASITVTLDIYGYLWPEHLDDVMARFDERHRGREAG
ncbi:MAG: tyrosine-type recombinase/integrase [Nitriliruptorales bacterium]